MPAQPCSRQDDTGPGKLPRLPAAPRLSPPTFGGMTPAGGSGVFTILVPVWCHGLLLASHVLVYVSDRSWTRTFHLPGQRHVALGIQCVFKTHIHCDSKIMAALHKEASELRCHVKTLDDFWKQPLLQPKASRSSLGVTLDLTGLGDVQKGIDLFVADVIASWACDAFYLAKLVTICARLGACQVHDFEQGTEAYAQQSIGQQATSCARPCTRP